MSFTAGLVLGIEIGKKRFISNVDNSDANITTGKLRAIVDNETSSLKIVIEGENENNDVVYNEYNFTYVMRDISKSVTTKVTSGDTETTHTQTFTRSLIESLLSNGKLLLQAHYSNEETGEIDYYIDNDGKKIYLDGGYA